ncbi:MAG: hypothetical protein AB2A00_25840 [Myxococcota bacterium]
MDIHRGLAMLNSLALRFREGLPALERTLGHGWLHEPRAWPPFIVVARILHGPQRQDQSANLWLDQDDNRAYRLSA